MGNKLDDGVRAMIRLEPFFKVGFSMTAALLLNASAGRADDVPRIKNDEVRVIELRQYKTYPGKRDVLITLFERAFVESQEALGMKIVGTFRDRNDPLRFTWIRGFRSMEERGPALNAFYFGPVWQAHRDEANPTLDDNDNVLLLKPAAPNLAFRNALAPRAQPDAAPSKSGIIVVTIYYLWKDPSEGFSEFFRTRLQPALESSGLPVIGAYVPERSPNNFPRLPVRQSENVFVWFTRVDSVAQFDQHMRTSAHLVSLDHSTAAAFTGFQERSRQVLYLEPTARSELR
jgi:NIPSNAP